MSAGIYKGYKAAGADFLAYRMRHIFTQIETPADIALHNDTLKEVLEIIEGAEEGFFETLANDMLYTKIDRKKRFLHRLAARVLNFGMQSKGQGT